MMKWLLSFAFLLLTLLSFSEKLSAQLPDYPIINQPKLSTISHSIYLEGGGNAYLASVNYDIIFKGIYGIRIGISPSIFFYDTEETSTNVNNEDLRTQALLMGTRFFGNEQHKFETGIGVLFGEEFISEQFEFPALPALTATFGYRIIPVDGGLTFKAAFTPIFTAKRIYPRIGVSLGYAF